MVKLRSNSKSSCTLTQLEGADRMVSRPMTREERKNLKGFSSGSDFYIYVFVFPLLLGFSFLLSFGTIELLWSGLGLLLDLPSHRLFEAEIRWVSAVFSIGLTAWVAQDEARRKAEWQTTDVDQDILNGFCNVTELNVLEAVEVSQFEDEGTGYLLQLTDNRILSLVGQHLDAYAHEPEPDPSLLDENQSETFPHDKIEIVTAPLSGVVLSVNGIGSSLEPRSKVEMTKRLAQSKRYPDNGRYFDGTLSELVFSLGLKETALR